MTTISITNTGISIPKKELTRVFERFYQVEKSLTREHGGIGLGLSIAKGMVNVCGGEIYAESEEGKSTTFTFTLPLDNSHLKERSLKI
jgi:two-component system sensor histidine kinase VicK